ncbi:MAG: alpha-amylase/4-alpha-glucanotransferase domain-containing protein, partial [Spirochaeta sp.]
HAIGGSLFELDSMKTQQNYINTMARHPEVYHSEDAIAFGYDTYSRTAFLDHFVAPEATQQEFETGVPDGSSRFHLEPYRVRELNRDQYQLTLEIEGPVGAGLGNIGLTKSYSFSKQAITVQYFITNIGEQEIKRVFMPEINLSFPDLRPTALRVWGSRDAHATEEVAPEHRYHGDFSRIQFHHQAVQQTVSIVLDRVSTVWGNPIRTQNLYYDGKTTITHQGCTVLPRWELRLSPGESWSTSISLQLSS